MKVMIVQKTKNDEEILEDADENSDMLMNLKL